MEANEKEELSQAEQIQHGNISLVLNSYNDIFSSFDPRPFAEKALSVDFIEECIRAARDKPEGGIELILSLPKNRRSINDEFKIRKRLREHFKKHTEEKSKEILKIKREGFSWIIAGVLLTVVVAFAHVFTTNITTQSLFRILEIPGWFGFWEGLGKIFIDSKKLEPDKSFYKKMSDAQIIFRSY